ncbi:MAG TPA: hypothetical protein PLK99_12205, partial [Burkholderiales bacterium]|nr:hypothetical protein [Burkholderiales bacterium]
FPELPAQPGKLKWKLKSALKRLACSDRAICNSFRKMPDFHSQDTGRECHIPSWRMDEECRNALEKMDIVRVRQERRRVWAVWEEWAGKMGLTPVYRELLEGACPLAFPVRTGSAEESRKWFEWGWRRGLYVHSWPALPEQVIESDYETVRLWKTIVCFPIMPEMDAWRLSKRLGV